MRSGTLVVGVTLAFAAIACLISFPPGSQQLTGLSMINTELPEIHFCPAENCTLILARLLNSSHQSIDCALYDVDLPQIIAVLKAKSQELPTTNNELPVRLVTDSLTFRKVANLSFAKHGKNSSLMHNKFCVIDGNTVFTGSFNPAKGSLPDDNDIVIVRSPVLAANYAAEFRELWNGTFGKGPQTVQSKVGFVETYFCPEDMCSARLREKLMAANRSIHFMAFSFTHEGIATDLVIKARQGVDVSGVIEKRNSKNYSVMPYLAENGIKVCLDWNKYDMHHKVFIIDSRFVATGSFNPTRNADQRNDENLLVIDNPLVAADYEREFAKLMC